MLVLRRHPKLILISYPPSRLMLRHVAFVCGLLLLCHVPAAHAADALVFDQRNTGAAAFFSTVDPTGCVSTGVFVVAEDDSERIVSDEAVRTAQVSVVVSQVDLCAVVQLLTGVGTTTDAVVSVAPNLQSATVSAVVPVLNGANGQLVNVSVELTFAATSPIRAEAGDDLYEIPGYRINTTFRQTFRTASAVGVIAADEAPVIAGSSVEAMIQNAGIDTIVISTK